MTLTHLDLDRIEGLPEEHRALATNHERIWLSPRCEDERTWCQDDIGCCDECGEPTVEYVRADIAAARIRELEGALGELVNSLASSEQVPIKDPDYGDMVRELGKRIGFGALMSAASGEWRAVLAERGDPLGSEFVSGPCRAVLEHDMARARTALQRKTS